MSANWRACPELPLRGLDEADARALLETVIPGPIDERIRDRIVAETRGNPLALLELPRGRSAAELAGGFAVARSGRAVRQHRERLPAAARRAPGRHAAAVAARGGRSGGRAAAPVASGRAARDPSGGRDAGGRRGPDRDRRPGPVPSSAGALGGVPLGITGRALRAARGARRGHRRRAPSRPARMAPRPGGIRARPRTSPTELERSAARAQARGGIAAAAAFLESAATLTPEPAERVRRLLAAAQAKRDAGALEAALQLLSAAEAGPTSALQAAEIEHLRGEIAFDQRRVGDAARLLVSAARRFEPLDPELARATHLEALGAAVWAADLDSPGALARGGRSRPRRAARARPARRGGCRARRARGAADGGVRGGRAGDGASAGDGPGAEGPRRGPRPLAVADGPAGDRADRARPLGRRRLARARLAPGAGRARGRRARAAAVRAQLLRPKPAGRRGAERGGGARRGGARDRAGDGQLGGGLRGDDARRPGAARSRRRPS